MSLFDLFKRRPSLPDAAEALPGRPDAIRTAATHFVSGQPLKGPFPAGSQSAIFGAGCFWGIERKFWQADGVVVTAAGYAGGHTPNPTYREVCSGRTGHNEVVLVIFDPTKTSYERLLKLFFETHDPTQGMRQGNDVGTQYRSGLYVTSEAQRETATRIRAVYEAALRTAGRRSGITTEIVGAPPFYYAEADHQQYLARNPNGYCGVGGTGVACPIGVGVAAA